MERLSRSDYEEWQCGLLEVGEEEDEVRKEWKKRDSEIMRERERGGGGSDVLG